MVFIYSPDTVLVLDGDVKQNHSVKATISEFPLEDGSFTNDHSILKPRVFTVGCAVVDQDNPSDVFDSLEKLRDDRQLLSIQTNLRLYESFMIEGIDTVEDTGSDDMVMFNLSFKEVKFSKSKQVKIERKKLKGPGAKDKLQSKTNRGTVDHKKVKVEKVSVPTSSSEALQTNEAVVTEDKSSILYRILK